MTSEFLPGGLIPLIADDLGQSVSGVGQLVSIFAFTVVLTTAPLSALTRRLPPKPVLIVGLAAIALGNLAVAAAPSFAWLVGARVAGGMAHGLFWAVAVGYAAYLVPPDRLGRAIAITAAGGSAAGILGVPLGNALGSAFGWRLAFAVVAAAGAAVIVVLWRWLPSVALPGRSIRSGRQHDVDVNDRSLVPIIALCGLILLVVASQASFGTYTAAWLIQVAGLSENLVPGYLLLTGLVGAGGVLLAGRLQDRYPRATLPIAGGFATLALASFPFVAALENPPAVAVTAVALSLAFAGMPMMLQTRLMGTASTRLRLLAGAAQTVTINIAIGGGALLGGLIIDTFAIQVLPWTAAVGMAVAVICTLLFDARTRQVRETLMASSSAG